MHYQEINLHLGNEKVPKGGRGACELLIKKILSSSQGQRKKIYNFFGQLGIWLFRSELKKNWPPLKLKNSIKKNCVNKSRHFSYELKK